MSPPPREAPRPTPASGAPARLLIVDDSVVARAVIGRMIDSGDHFTVVGAVSDARAALAFLADHQVEIVLLDIELPGTDGLSALPDILAAGKGAKVLVVSSSAHDGGAAAIQALALGAADTLEKPESGAQLGPFADLLAAKLGRLVHTRPNDSSSPTPSPLPLAQGDDFDVVAIGASTGGIHALSRLLRAIPPDFSLPILITQHLPASFMPYFAAQIAMLAGRPCAVAAEHMRLTPGRVLLAPGDAHIRVVRSGTGAAVRLDRQPVQSGCMPSVDPMFASVAQVYGARALAVVLSGMGRDGAQGARAVVDAGGCVIAQDQASSVVWGMPGAVANAGIASAILPPDVIGQVVVARRRVP
ncbi:chemotaxis-specific protein-glutamate methyltransferase CheB [Hephaestia sp. GCM10023244]|uniref:chemotaxis-specific protein-glutamate methyltransferase CheB n=1 Tax=unclassified Hephaestia TaxID=2631281 RepID=UPI00207754DD|nr:chemotaxis-specific protein-glutamate methyltransferase CheB [Hephaestia sp. MAHUQ-44]MCM8730104.1 chemotaxis-specific protein-glutamate methyltransferase CheB [Hephaestia sp. MAHUQ-44]